MKSVSKKVCLLGDFAVGKTSLVRRFVYDLFSDRYISTIGVKVSRKTVVVPAEPEVVEMTIMLWDLAGSEAFDLFRASYLRGSAGALLVCDLQREETLAHLASYVDQIRAVSPDAKFAIAANKADLDNFAIADAALFEFAAQIDAPVYFTSAKSGEKVDTLFRHLGRLLV